LDQITSYSLYNISGLEQISYIRMHLSYTSFYLYSHFCHDQSFDVDTSNTLEKNQNHYPSKM